MSSTQILMVTRAQETEPADINWVKWALHSNRRDSEWQVRDVTAEIAEKDKRIKKMEAAAGALIEDVRSRYGIQTTADFTCPHMRNLAELLGDTTNE